MTQMITIEILISQLTALPEHVIIKSEIVFPFFRSSVDPITEEK